MISSAGVDANIVIFIVIILSVKSDVTMQAGICYKYSTGGEHSENLSAALFPKVIQNPNIIQTESWLGMNRVDSLTADYNINTRQETMAT